MSAIGVAMSVRNGAQFLCEQLRSIEEQTIRPACLMIRDDHSTDGSVRILRDFAVRSKLRVVLTEGASQVGAAESFAAAITSLDTDVIALADQDDIWDARKLEVLRDLMDADPEAGLAVTNGRLVGEHRPAETVWDAFGAGPPPSRDPRTCVRALVAPSVPGCSLAFSARLLPVILPFPEGLGQPGAGIAHDGWIVALASALSNVAASNELLFSYRLHPDQMIGLRGVEAMSIGARVRRACTDAGDSPGVNARLGACELVIARLEPHARDPAAQASLAALHELRAHLRLRSALPTGLTARMRAAAGEYRRGAYGEFSSGAFSALVDLLGLGSGRYGR